MFGIPGEGIRQHYRILDISMVDVLVVVLVSVLLSRVGIPTLRISHRDPPFVFKHTGFLKIALCLFLIGVVAHRVFCVRTTVDKVLFRD